MSLEVRDMVPADLPATLDVYNELIESTTVAWTERPQTMDERRAWFAEQRRRGFPTLVAVDADEVVGMTSYGDFRDSIHWPHKFGRWLDLVLMQRVLEGAIEAS